MRSGLLVALLFLVSPASAQEAAPRDCVAQAKIVMEAVTARLDGQSFRKTRRTLRQTLDRTAGDMLAEWIYALPEDQLTEEVGRVWQTQCEAL